MVGRAGWVLLAVALSGCEPPDPEWEYRFLVPDGGEILAQESELPLEGWSPHYVTIGHGLVVVADRHEPRVVVLDSEGSYLYAIAPSEGEGPGELTLPEVLRIARDSAIWVLDGRQGRVKVFSHGGKYRDSFQIPMRAFAVLGPRELLLPPPPGSAQRPMIWEDGVGTPAPVTLERGEGEGPEGGAVGVLVPTGWMVSRGPSGEIALLHAFGSDVWVIRPTDPEWTAQRAGLPPAVTELASQVVANRAAMLGAPEGRSVAVPRCRDAQYLPSGHLWLETGMRGLLGAAVGTHDRSATLILSSEEEEFRGLRYASPFGDSQLLAFYEGRAQISNLVPAPPPDWIRR